jgi:hypothetical protein
MEYKLKDNSVDLENVGHKISLELGLPVAISVIGDLLYIHGVGGEDEQKVKDLLDRIWSPEEISRAIIEDANKTAEANRLSAYKQEADGLFFKAQAGECSLDEWKAKREEIKKRFPKVSIDSEIAAVPDTKPKKKRGSK